MNETSLIAHRREIRRMARWFAPRDPDLTKDLEQEALIAIWRFDPARVRGNARAVLLRVARDAMRMWLRRERRAQVIAAPRPVRLGRSRVSAAREPTVVPIRRFAPRHEGAAPVSESVAA